MRYEQKSNYLPCLVGEKNQQGLFGYFRNTNGGGKNVELQMDRAGVYFVSLTSGKEMVTRKVVVQR